MWKTPEQTLKPVSPYAKKKKVLAKVHELLRESEMYSNTMTDDDPNAQFFEGEINAYTTVEILLTGQWCDMCESRERDADGNLVHGDLLGSDTDEPCPLLS